MSRITIPQSNDNVKSHTAGEKLAAIWARVSTPDQMSLPDQIARCRARLEDAGYTVLHTFATDWGSMDLFSCPEFLRLRALMGNREVAAVATLDRDRLEAQGLQRLVFLSECRQSDVQLILAQGPPLLDEPEGQLVELALAIGKERSVLRARQGSRDGLRDRAVRRGLPTSYHKLYGYAPQRTLNRYVPDTDWPNLKLIFSMLLDGLTYTPIIRELETRGVPSPAGQAEWSKTAISTIAHNPAYAGRYYALKKRAVVPKQRRGHTYGSSSAVKVPLEDAHYLPDVEIVNPPITWGQRGQILGHLAKHQKLAQRNAKRDYLLRGFIECEQHQGKNGLPRKYHGIPKRGTYHYCCPVGSHRYLKGPDLENRVKQEIRNLFETEEDEMYERLSRGRNQQALHEDLRRELTAQEKRQTNLLHSEAVLEERFIADEVSEDVYPLLKAKYRAQRRGAQARRDELLIQLGQLGHVKDAVRALSELRERFLGRLDELADAEWRELLTTLNARIAVGTPFNQRTDEEALDWARNFRVAEGEDGIWLGAPVHCVTLQLLLPEACDGERVGAIVLDSPGSALHNQQYYPLSFALSDIIPDHPGVQR